jgi:alkaline phosphatase D
MMWDDHEIRDNWDDGNVAPYPDARSAFNEYQGGHNPAPATPGTLYYSFNAGRLSFFVLDTRSFRSPNGTTDGPAKTMLGLTQLNALKSWLMTSTATFKFIVSSVPFSRFGTTGSDAWEGFLNERNALFSFIRDGNIPGVVLVSGDQHWTSVFNIPGFAPYNFYEFMPTPMGTTNRNGPLCRADDPGRICASTGVPCDDSEIICTDDRYVGYGRFTANTAVTPATLTFDWINDAGNTVFSRTITTLDIKP